MFLEAIYHRPRKTGPMLITARPSISESAPKRRPYRSVRLAGDKYLWDQTMEYIPMTKLSSDEMFDYWECEATPPYRRLKYGFLLQKGDKKRWMTEYDFLTEPPANPDRLFEYPFINPDDVFHPPAWVKDAIFYQIFPERFANGDTSNDPDGTLPWAVPNRRRRISSAVTCRGYRSPRSSKRARRQRDLFHAAVHGNDEP